MIPCYFAVVGPTYIDCGRVYLSDALNRGWDNFRLRVKSSGSGVVVRPIDGVVLVGPLPHGTPMVGADGVVRLVVAGQGLARGGSSWRAAGDTTDEGLLADRLRAAFAIGGFAQLERAWRDARSLLGEQATAGPLAEVYEQLRR